MLASGDSHLTALTGGYQAAFLIGAVFAAAAAVLAAVLLRRGTGSAPRSLDETAAEAPEPFADAV